MRAVPSVGERVRVEAWHGPWGCAGSGDAEPAHTGDHVVTAVLLPPAAMAVLGWPFDEPRVTLKCLDDCPYVSWAKRYEYNPVRAFEVGVGALRAPYEPTLTERRALREARAELLAARAA